VRSEMSALQDLAAHVCRKKDVEPFGRQWASARPHGNRNCSVDRGCRKAQLVDEIAATCRATRDVDHAALLISPCLLPRTLPTAPAAPDTTTCRPASALPMSSNPNYSVIPGIMPSEHRYGGSGANRVSPLAAHALASETAYCGPPSTRDLVDHLELAMLDATDAPRATAAHQRAIYTGMS